MPVIAGYYWFFHCPDKNTFCHGKNPTLFRNNFIMMHLLDLHYVMLHITCCSSIRFSDIFPKQLEVLVQILHAYCTFLSMPDYKFLLNYLQLWRSYPILSATTQRAFRPMVDILSIGWSHLIWHNFVKIAGNWIKICSLA